MSAWLSDRRHHPSERHSPRAQWAGAALRAIDVGLAAVALAILCLPLLIAALLSRRSGRSLAGRGAAPFTRWHLELPGHAIGRALGALGAANWPVVLNILRGDMAWVGPAALPWPCVEPGARHSVRPGLVCEWDIRRRTAVAFAGEAEAALDYLAHRGLAHDMGVLLRATVLAALPVVAADVQGPKRIRICDVTFDNVDMNEALERLERMLEGGDAHQVCFVNPACVNIAARDRGYRRSLGRASLVLPDGIGMKIAADLLGTSLKQNVNGTDLFPRLCALLEKRGTRLYLLGGQPGVPEGVAAVIAQRWPGVKIVGLRHGFFGPGEEGQVAAQVRASGADIVLVARGVPTQDVFVDRCLHHFGVKLAIGVGGLFDFVSGRIPRAPRWMRDSGLEWVYRLMQEPRRMWRRYLVGNLTFLVRVILQRLNLRRSIDDRLDLGLPLGAGVADDSMRPIAMLFATQTAHPDIPVASDHPAALLPFGPSSFVERAVAELAQAGVREIHIVACSRPELLREALGDGSRWGTRLVWHVIKDVRGAPQQLRQLAADPQRRLILGWAQCWVDRSVLRKLVEGDHAAHAPDRASGPWCPGWLSLPLQRAQALAASGDMRQFESDLLGAGLPPLVTSEGEWACADSPTELLDAQARVAVTESLEILTEAWIATPWGAVSPRAYVSPAARIEGPVWIGPNCFVDAGAQLGPGTVLVHDVVVSSGTRVADAIVLPGTLVGRGLELERAIAKVNLVQNVRLGVRMVLPAEEGLIGALKASRPARPGLPGRVLACSVMAVAAPAVAAYALWARLSERPFLWHREKVVVGWRADIGAMRISTVRLPNPALRGVVAVLAQMGPILDIATGHRHWFGARPRRRMDWYALHPEWQTLLDGMPLGWLHARAWSDADNCPIEARAAADLVLLMRPRGLAGLRSYLRLVVDAVPGAGSPSGG